MVRHIALLGLLAALSCTQTPESTGFEERLLATVTGDINDDDVAFSVDGRHVAWPEVDESEVRMVRDGKRGSKFTAVSRPRFSPFLYLASTETETFYVGDKGRVSRGYDWASKDYHVLKGMRLAFLAGLNKRNLIVVGDKDIEVDGFAMDLVVGHGRWACRVASPKGQQIISDRGAGPFFETIHMPAISPDGVIAYGASRHDGPRMKYFLVKGDDVKEMEGTVKVVAFGPEGQFAYGGFKGRGGFLSIDGREQQADQFLGTPFFGPGGSVAYRAGMSLRKEYYMVDGKLPDRWYEEVRHGTYGPKTGFAHTARLGDKWKMIIDGVAHGEYDFVWAPVFSADGRRVGFGVRQGRELWWKVVNRD